MWRQVCVFLTSSKPQRHSERVVWECRSGAVIVTVWPGGFMSLWWSVTLFHFLGCKDESRGRATCIKLVKEMGIQVCYTDVAPLKAKLERSCGETCKFCKHHKWYSHNSLNARPNRPFHRFFLFYWVLLRPLREYQSTVVARVPWN